MKKFILLCVCLVIATSFTFSLASSDEVIDVFLICHSHCDAGWLETVDQYYDTEVSVILTQVVNALAASPDKKFVWSEIVYFSMWWEEQSPEIQQIVRNLVNEKRFEFVGGGWVQNDEAVAHFNSVIDQLTQGHQFILDNFGVTPTVGWQIDPFGPSTNTPVLLTLAGFKYLVINRLDDRLKIVFDSPPVTIIGSGTFQTNQHFEWWWQSSDSYQGVVSLFTHDLETSYSPPAYCYANASNPFQQICTGFDFEASNITNPPITPENIAERAEIFVNIMKSKSPYYRHNKLLVPFGNDFRYQNAELEFGNMDPLMKYINSNSSFGVQMRYATVTDYFEAVFNSSQVPQFPVQGATDFYPYTTCWSSDLQFYNTCANYWSGFYTSYPELKRDVRESDALLRVGELIYSLGRASGDGSEMEPSWDKLFDKIDILRKASAVLNHHDAVTGTAKTYVRENYEEMLENGTLSTNEVIEETIAYLLNKENPLIVTTNDSVLQNIPNGFSVPVILFNPLTWSREEFVKVAIGNLDVTVLDENGTYVPSQIVENVVNDAEWNLYFYVHVPPLSYSTYYLSSENLEIKEKAIFLPAQKLRGEQQIVSLENEYYRVDFEFQGSRIFQLSGVYSKFEQIFFPVTQQLYQYLGLMDDAYHFRPHTSAFVYPTLSPQSIITLGPYIQEITLIYSSNVSQVFRLYNSPNNYQKESFFSRATSSQAFLEIENHVGVGVPWEMVQRFTVKNMTTSGYFYNDNGMETLQRKWQVRYNDTHPWSLISGNYYPVITTAIIRDNSTNSPNQLTLLTKQSVGGSSQFDGSLEVMLQRRGDFIQWSLNETLNDTTIAHVSFRTIFGSKKLSENIRPQTQLEFENPIFRIYGIPQNLTVSEWNGIQNSSLTFVRSSLPPNVHLMSLKALSKHSPYLILRLQHIYAINQDPAFSTPITVDITELFEDYNLFDIYETTLTANQVINMTSNKYSPQSDFVITLNPLEIRTFVVGFEKKVLPF